MIEISTVIKREYIEGKPVVNGRVTFDDSELSDGQLAVYERNPKFTVRRISGQDATGLVSAGDVVEYMRNVEERYSLDLSAEMSSIIAAIERALPVETDEEKILDAVRVLGGTKKPAVKDVAELSGCEVSAAQRDAAWDYINENLE